MSGSRKRRPPRASRESGDSGFSTSTLTVWHYDSALGAAAGEVRLRDLEEHGALTVIDAVTLVWMPATPHPRVGRLRSRTGSRARRGAVLGALAGALVLSPVAGAAAGAGIGALAGRLRSTGIDESFLEEVKGRLRPGTSALLVLSRDADLEMVRPALERGRSRGDVTLMHALLRADAPDALRDLVDDISTNVTDPPVSGEPTGTTTALPSQPGGRSRRSPRSPRG